MDMGGMQQTSLLAWDEIKQDLGDKQKIVLDTIRGASYDGLTNMEISKILDWSVNRVTPRVNELRKLGLVVLVCKRNCRVTGYRALAWGALHSGGYITKDRCYDSQVAASLHEGRQERYMDGGVAVWM